jgi:hypothetical protein
MLKMLMDRRKKRTHQAFLARLTADAVNAPNVFKSNAIFAEKPAVDDKITPASLRR